MLLSGLGLLDIDIHLAGGSLLTILASGQGSRRIPENSAGICDLSASKIVFRFTFSLLSGVNFIVVHLLGVDSISEVYQNIQDGI